MRRFQHLGIEEGGLEQATLNTLLVVVREWWKQNWRTSRIVHSYALFMCAYIVVMSIRPPLLTPAPRVRGSPDSLAPLYHSMVATRVQQRDAHFKDTVDDINFVMTEKNFTCLSAIHVGVPLHVFQMHDNVFINAKIHDQGSIISKGRESSAFFPLRHDVLVTRYIPVTISYDNGLLYSSRTPAEAHCILHMLDQLSGISIYD